jgi:hypothetical protein
MAESARARGDVSGAAGRLEHAYECGGKRDASLLIAAATWLAGAHEEAHARALLAIASRHTLTPDQAAQATVIAKAIGQ